MNYLAHTHVALASGRDEPLYVLGAVLPDLASMAGIRLQRDRLEGEVAEGVRCHVATDNEFHGHQVFRRGSAAIRKELAVAGLSSGPARAIGHIGWELLADGALVRSPTEDAYWHALDYGEVVTDSVRPHDRPRWESLLSHRDQRPRLRYDDPAWVAERLFSMLTRRPRLAFPRADLPAVTAVLEAHQDTVTDEAGPVLADVTRRTNASGTAPQGDLGAAGAVTKRAM